MDIDTTDIRKFLMQAPTPWTQDSDGQIWDAKGGRVWDVPDANDDPELAGAVMRLVNQVGAKS